MGFRLKQKSKRIRFNNFTQQRAAMDKLCRRITRGHDPKKMVVFFGAAVCSRGFRYAPTPVKGLRRHLRRYARVIIIQEHYTSQRCSFCAFKPEWITKPPHSHRKLQPGRDRQHPDPKKAENVHGVRWCPVCRKIHQRDINSARCMLELGIHI